MGSPINLNAVTQDLSTYLQDTEKAYQAEKNGNTKEAEKYTQEANQAYQKATNTLKSMLKNKNVPADVKEKLNSALRDLQAQGQPTEGAAFEALNALGGPLPSEGGPLPVNPEPTPLTPPIQPLNPEPLTPPIEPINPPEEGPR